MTSLAKRLSGIEGEVLEPEYTGCKIICPFCSAAWSEQNISAFDLDAGDHCQSGRFYAECCTIDITCHACNRLMYRKEGFELR